MNSGRKSGGYTLIEMLAVLAILPILLLLLHVTLSGTLDVVEVAGRAAEEAQVVRSLRNMFERDLAVCVLPAQKKPKTRQEDESLYSMFLGRNAEGDSSDSLSFVTLRPSRASRPALDLNEVAYELRRKMGEWRYFTLVRREQPLYDELPAAGGTYQEVYDRVLSFDVEYFDGKEWLGEWDASKKKTLPCAVHIVLKIALPGEENGEAVIETIVCVPASTLSVSLKKE
jgi:type II secretion system protein J